MAKKLIKKEVKKEVKAEVKKEKIVKPEEPKIKDSVKFGDQAPAPKFGDTNAVPKFQGGVEKPPILK